MWRPLSRLARAVPMMAVLSDSVAPEVKVISFGEAFTRAAICSRARSTASPAVQPKEWFEEAGLPKWFVRNGTMASNTRGSTWVEAWLSM